MPAGPDDVTPAAIAELVQRYVDGETIEGLTERYPVSYRKVRALLLNAGVTLRPPKIPLPPAPPGLANAYRDGRSIRQLAKTHGMSYNQTRRILLSLGVQLRSRGASQLAPRTSPSRRDRYS